jgi:hypothetical protein
VGYMGAVSTGLERRCGVENGKLRSWRGLSEDLEKSGICVKDLRGDRAKPTDPVHSTTPAIEERVYSEMLAQRIRPTQPW